MTNIIPIISLPFLLGGGLLLALNFLSYDAFLQFMDTQQVATHPISTYLSFDAFQTILHKARYMSVGFFVLFTVMILNQKTLLKTIQTLKTDTCDFHTDLKKALLKSFKEDGKLYHYALMLICIIGFALRLYYLNQPIKNDEATVFLSFATKPFYIIISAYTNVGNHIFHTLLMHFSWLLFGDALWAIRLPTFIAGCFIIPITYFIIRAGYGRLTAIMTTGLIASSSAWIEYSVNSRGYEIQALLIVLLIGLAQYLLHRSNRYAEYLWIFLTALGFWTLPTFFYAYGSVALWFLLSLLLLPSTIYRQRLQTFKRFIFINQFAALLTFLLYSPVFLTFGIGHMNTMFNQASQVNLQDIIPRSIELWQLWTRNVPSFLQLILLGFAILGFISQTFHIFKRYRTPNTARSSHPIFSVNLLACSLLWIALSSILIQPYALMNNMLRLWLTHSLFFYLSIALGFNGLLRPLKRSRTSFILLPIMLLFCFFSVQEIRYNYIHNILEDSFHDAKAMVQYFKDHLQPGDWILATCPYGTTLRYELTKQKIPYRIISTLNDKGEKLDLFAFNTDKALNLKAQDRIFIIEVPQYKNLSKVIEESNIHRWYENGIHPVATFSKATLYFTQLAGKN